MMYIKLKDDMSLVVTVRQALYRGDNLNRKVTYLIPTQVGEIDIQTACLYLSYIRADGAADVAMLERMDEMYNDEYYQYTFPVTCKLTKYAGPVCSWLQIYAGDPSNPEISKSDECILQIQESKDMDDYLSDSQITALYQMGKAIENNAAGIDESIARMNENIAGKADDIFYDDEGNYLQLMANGVPIGSQIDMESVSDDVFDEVIDFGGDSDEEPEGDTGDSTTEGNGSSDVIYF